MKEIVIFGILLAGLFIRVCRSMTNKCLTNGQIVPVWLSVVNLIGQMGFAVLLIAALFHKAWLLAAIVVGFYLLANAGRSLPVELVKSPQVAVLAATQQAVGELNAMPEGSDKLKAVMKRTDEIMRSHGFVKNADSSETES